MPKPLLTRDQLRLLAHSNIATGKYKTNSDIGIPSKRYFNNEVKNIVICGRKWAIFYRDILIIMIQKKKLIKIKQI